MAEKLKQELLEGVESSSAILSRRRKIRCMLFAAVAGGIGWFAGAQTGRQEADDATNFEMVTTPNPQLKVERDEVGGGITPEVKASNNNIPQEATRKNRRLSIFVDPNERLNSLGMAKKEVAIALLDVPFCELEERTYEWGFDNVPGVVEWLEAFSSLRKAIMNQDLKAIATQATIVNALTKKMDAESGADENYHRAASKLKKDPEGRILFDGYKAKLIMVANLTQILACCDEEIEK